jgi:hypothetical protein
MRAEPVAAQNLFPTLHILASLPGKNSRFALKQFSRRALRYGGRVPRKNLPIAARGPAHMPIGG